HDNVVGQMDCAPGLLRALEDAFRLAGEFVLAQGLANVDSARGKEGVGHAAADNQVVDLADEVTEDCTLRRHLCAANYCSDGALGISEGLLKRLKLCLHRAPG